MTASKSPGPDRLFASSWVKTRPLSSLYAYPDPRSYLHPQAIISHLRASYDGVTGNSGHRLRSSSCGKVHGGSDSPLQVHGTAPDAKPLEYELENGLLMSVRSLYAQKHGSPSYIPWSVAGE